jgi:hypothetical protein
MMLGHPDAAIAPDLRMGGKIASVIKCASRVGLFGDANKPLAS